MRNTALILILICSALFGTSARAADALEQGFKTPPDSAKPWVYWFWMNGNITKEGITADLEAMKRVGIGGAVMMSVSGLIPQGRVDFLTEEWRGMFQHAMSEASRLGIQITMNNADGSAGSGGPWNSVEHSMQILTSSKTNIAGPCKLSQKLPLPRIFKCQFEIGSPEATEPYYRDIAVFALRLSVENTATMRQVPSVVTASSLKFDGSQIIDDRDDTDTPLPLPEPGKPQFIEFQFSKPFTARSLTVHIKKGPQEVSGELMVSDDGVKYTHVSEIKTRSNKFVMTFGAMVDISFPPVTGKFYRIVFTKAGRGSARPGLMNIAEIELHNRLQVPNWRNKAGFMFGYNPVMINTNWFDHTGSAQRADIIDVTKYLATDGTLNWNVPAGNWTILRVGHTSTGKMGHPCTPNGIGLECDKMSKEALEIHFAGFLEKMILDSGSLAGKTLIATHIDSYEEGPQNWTPKFREEFQTRRGYDLLPLLPVALGYAVESPEVSERFLWDFRRTCADLMADNTYGYLRTLAGRFGMKLSAEPYNGDFDYLQSAVRVDIPMGEFTTGNMNARGIEAAASAAHTMGHRYAGAEAFTAHSESAGWRDHPFFLKALGDIMYSSGINRFVLHRWALQPWTNRPPGMTLGPWGSHIERTTTWFEQGTAWFTYLSRCQYLLQEGSFAADFCVFTGEYSPNKPELPQCVNTSGYSYDFLNSEILLTATVHNGAIELPSGMRYRVLVLPEDVFMTPAVARKIRELVRGGAVVLGPKPERSPSLQNFPDCDKEVKAIAAEVWGDCDGKTKQEYPSGKGKVFWGKPLADVFSSIGVAPDFESKATAGKTKIHWIHRHEGEAEVYFVASETNAQTAVDATFRVDGKVPEFWYPDTGRIETVGVWKTENGRTIVPINFDPCGSVFVVFRKPGTPEFTALSGPKSSGTTDAQIRMSPKGFELVAGENGRYEIASASGTKSVEITGVPEPLAVTGPWKVSFPPKFGAPPAAVFEKLISWPEHTVEGIKYFSGSATYTKEIDIPADMIGKDIKLTLDLGKVEVIAEVNVNGKDDGILWKPPFKTDITALVKPGKNTLKIRVTNLWINRLIGDEFKPPYLKWKSTGKNDDGGPAEWPDWVKDGGSVPDTGRITFTTWHHWKKEDKPVPSGLLGPVTIQAAEVKKIDLQFKGGR